MRTLTLTVHDEDPAEADRVTRQLRTDLLSLDLDHVELAGDGQLPPNAKGADPDTVTTIIVGLASSPVLVQLGRVLQSVVNRGRDRKITVRDGERSLEITGTTNDDNRRAVEAFFRTDYN